ncbi:alpha/beta-hydrolase [Annulohypoxylon maeteangense]|uniref:alpha/beta-hydrolase n=1 Tax=Annulohypoxylon maeteangense TaxID=1927788 RepID=UPI002008BC80|nr:alpha/beta-hydrolase [Annulohypoxylon maeteangense]KAI0886703.1 alpha/beta-hydrolase [Annulohypoxylon maeteangense]
MTANIKISCFLLVTYAGALSFALGPYGSNSTGVLPTVDLGYEIHQGSVNKTGNYYIFNNIPYAEQPIGELRFQKPVPINDIGLQVNDTKPVNNGYNITVVCPQAYPEWVISLTAERRGIAKETAAVTLNGQAGQTEACLVLDVYVPDNVFIKGVAAEAPVLVWIHGGGFTFGSKSFYGNPSGLISQSRGNGQDGIIVVSINYRLGMYGWLAGNDVTPNLGLYDQRVALEWVQKYIGLFGGSKDKVTVMGESAGASSIVHHITAYGGNVSAPFQRAIPQSPAFQFNIDLAAGYNKTLTEASKQLGVTVKGIAGLRNLPAAALMAINQGTVMPAPIGTFGFGIGPDGTYVPDVAQILLYQGKFDSNVDILTSHTSNESVPFLPPEISTSADVLGYVRASLPQASDSTIEALLTDPGLYPDILNNSLLYPWTTEYGRVARITSDIGFACTARYLASATQNAGNAPPPAPAPVNANTPTPNSNLNPNLNAKANVNAGVNINANTNAAKYAYTFAYPPGWHETDVPYVFFDGDTSTSDNGLPVNATLAAQLQEYIVGFVKYGDPNAGVGRGGGGGGGYNRLVRFPVYGVEGRVLELGAEGFRDVVDDLKGRRCEWIQRAMVDGRL